MTSFLNYKYNSDIISDLIEFKNEIQQKGAKLFVTFPCFQESSFENIKSYINKVENELKKNNFTLLGNPSKYKIADSLIFNSPYHLLKKGVDIRTKILIHDLKKHIAITK